MTAFYVSLLATAIRAPWVLIPCGHQLQGSGPTGNRNALGLLANDDATCFLTFAYDRCNQQRWHTDKNSYVKPLGPAKPGIFDMLGFKVRGCVCAELCGPSCFEAVLFIHACL